MACVRKCRRAWVADFTDQNGHRRVLVPRGHFPTSASQKRAAQDLLVACLAECDIDMFVSVRERMTFDRLANRWISSKVRISDTTRSSYSLSLSCFVLPYFGHRKAASLSAMDLENF